MKQHRGAVTLHLVGLLADLISKLLPPAASHHKAERVTVTSLLFFGAGSSSFWGHEVEVAMIMERLARVLAEFNRRRRDLAAGRRLVQHVLETARGEALIAAEAARAGERLDLARHLFFWAASFVRAREGRWVFEHWQRWRIAWDMEVDSSGHLWKAGEAHGFGRVPARIVTTPEELASLYPTSKLLDAMAATEGNVWLQALSKELASLLLPRGRVL